MEELQSDKKDFFISFNKADNGWAEWIAWTLEANGYRVVFQNWDFRPGSNFVQEMDKATRNTECTIAILSPDYLDALYTQSEWQAAFAADPTSDSRRLIPVRVEKCDLKGLLAQIIYIDLVGKDKETARKVLLSGVEHERGKPTDEPRFLGEEPVFLADNPMLSQREVFDPKNFVDREEAIIALKQWLEEDEDKSVCFLKGPSGRGKTYLAAKFYKQISSNTNVEMSSNWQGIWVDCLTNDRPLEMESFLTILLSPISSLEREDISKRVSILKNEESDSEVLDRELKKLEEKREEMEEDFDTITNRNLPFFTRHPLLWKYLTNDKARWVVVLNDYHVTESSDGSFIKEFVKHAIDYDNKIKVLVTTSKDATKTKSETKVTGGYKDLDLGRLDQEYAQDYLQKWDLSVNEAQAVKVWEKCGQGEPKAMNIFAGIAKKRRSVDSLLMISIPDWSDKECDKWLNKMLSFLSDEEKEAAMAASIFLEPVEREAIEQACDINDAGYAIDGLIDTHLLDKFKDKFLFHRVLREYFQKQLLNHQKEGRPGKMHEQVARWLEDQGNRAGLTSSAILEYIRRAFFHWREAGKIDKALGCAHKVDEYSLPADRPDICKEALQMARQLERDEDALFWTHRLAVAYLELSNITEAERYFVIALDQARQMGNKQLESEALYGLSQIAEEQDQIDEALTWAGKGLRVAEEIEGRIAALKSKNIIQNQIIHLQRVLEERDSKKGERKTGENMPKRTEDQTNPTGRCFLSYRRSRQHEADLLIAAQHDRGIPTWQDVNNLEEFRTEDEIRQVLDDPTTASAILWLTPDVKDSNFIREVEAPLILDRVRRQDVFFAIPMRAGGLKVSEVDEILNPRFSLESLSGWNLREANGDPINAAEAGKIAKLVLNRRIPAIHKSLPDDEPLRIELYTRTPAPFQLGTALRLDWSERFEGRLAKSGAWEDYLLPALKDVVDAVQLHAQPPRRAVEVSGLAALPAALALGYEFMETRGIKIAWRQPTKGREDQLWSLDVAREPSGFKTETISGATSAKHLAVLISVAADADAGFAASREDLEPFRAIVRVFKPGREKHDVTSPEQARDIAEIVSIAIRDARLKYRPTGFVHLFAAVPVGLAMMIGQKLNTLGPVQTYEHLQTDLVGRYYSAALLRPST